MDLTSAENIPRTSKSGTPKRSRSLPTGNVVALHSANTAKFKRVRNAISGRAEASKAAKAARTLASSHEKTVASLMATLPPLNEAHKDITAAKSRTALRIITVVFEIMNPDPS